jgi:GrpB-like predicted nucleotidyltransferase (UPF0157 family)
VSTEVRVVPHDPRWSAVFAVESEHILAALALSDCEVHHIGSTAIRGISAKPIIDLLLMVPEIRALDAHASRLQALGYEVMGEYGIPGRRYFRKHSLEGQRTHHLHAFVRGSAAANRHLAFRDYMNAHVDAAQQYGALKEGLAAAFPHDGASYTAGKDAFVAAHVERALAWQASR